MLDSTKQVRINIVLSINPDEPLPCIVHWRQRHFVVVYAIKKRRKFSFLPGTGKTGNPGIEKSSSNDENVTIHVGNPASGLIKYSKEEFLKCWLSTTKGGEREGTALLLEPTPYFYRQYRCYR